MAVYALSLYLHCLSYTSDEQMDGPATKRRKTDEAEHISISKGVCVCVCVCVRAKVHVPFSLNGTSTPVKRELDQRCVCVESTLRSFVVAQSHRLVLLCQWNKQRKPVELF